MNKINQCMVKTILNKTIYAHSAEPYKEGLSNEQIKGLFYKAITDPDNSVISEINRIVDEANADIEKIDASTAIGELSSYPHTTVKEQKYVKSGASFKFYGACPKYTLQELSSIASTFGLNEGGAYLFLRLTAPDDLIPDNTLSFVIGDTTLSGLSALSGSAEYALQGVYYIDFCVKLDDSSVIALSIKWNSNDSTHSFIIDATEYAFNALTKTFIVFADDAMGTNMTTSWTTSKKFMGVMNGIESSQNYQDYVWAQIYSDPPATQSITLSKTSWSNYEQTVSVNDVTSSCWVICTPSPSGNNQTIWSYYGIKCISQANGSLTFKCRETPSANLIVNLLIGV